MTMLERQAYQTELEAREPRPADTLIEQAREMFAEAMFELAAVSAVFENRLMMMMQPVYSSACDTLMVTAKPGTGTLLVINPHFFVNRLVDKTERAKALVHEALHVINRHLHTGHSGQQWTIATEVACNQTMMDTLGKGMFTVHPEAEDGTIDRNSKEELGVNPEYIHQKYRDDLSGQGKEYVAKEVFWSTDLKTLTELNRMTKPPKPPRGRAGWGCEHADGSSNGDPLPFDEEEIDDTMDEVLDAAVDIARGSGEAADQMKDALKRTFDHAEGSEKATKAWGDHSIGELFGEPVQRRQVKFWEQWLRRNLATRLRPGRRLRFNKKLVAVDQQLQRDPILAYRGKRRTTLLWVAIDTSGSMSTEQLDWLRKYVGEEENIDVEFFNFDTNLVPIGAGDQFVGRGGTNFDCILDGYNEARSKPDCVLVVTDGYAPEIMPRERGKWVWLITAGGDDWPKRKGMATFVLPPPSEN